MCVLTCGDMSPRLWRKRKLSEFRGSGRDIDREILALAWPALGALVAEPLFVLVDSAVVGHLGTPQLAGLSLASTLLVTLVGLCIFLAYATTAAVARRSGAGRTREALQSASTACGSHSGSASHWRRPCS
jgi:Na+-driven multidrug efflux pump